MLGHHRISLAWGPYLEVLAGLGSAEVMVLRSARSFEWALQEDSHTLKASAIIGCQYLTLRIYRLCDDELGRASEAIQFSAKRMTRLQQLIRIVRPVLPILCNRSDDRKRPVPAARLFQHLDVLVVLNGSTDVLETHGWDYAR